MFGIGPASLFSDMSHETVTATLPALLASMGAAAGALGTIEGLADGLSSLAKLYGGWLADRLRCRKPLCAGGYGFMALSPVVIAIAAELVPSEIRGSGFGSLAIVEGLGDMFSSVTAGWLWALAGPALAFSCAVCLMTAGALLMFLQAVRPSRSPATP